MSATLCPTCGRRPSERGARELERLLDSAIRSAENDALPGHRLYGLAELPWVHCARQALCTHPCRDPLHDLADNAPALLDALQRVTPILQRLADGLGVPSRVHLGEQLAVADEALRHPMRPPVGGAQ